MDEALIRRPQAYYLDGYIWVFIGSAYVKLMPDKARPLLADLREAVKAAEADGK